MENPLSLQDIPTESYQQLFKLTADQYKLFIDTKKKYVLQDFYEFNKEVMGWKDLWEPLHHPLCNFIQDNKDKKRLILLPRGHLKSSVVTVSYALWKIAQNSKIRILIANGTAPLAITFLNQIKDHLAKNEKYRELFGDVVTEAQKWAEDAITIARSESFEAKESTVTAYGIGGNLVSQHYDVLILDDLVNRENIHTSDRIADVIQFYKDVMDLRDNVDSSEVIVIGCLVAGTKVTMANGTLKSIEKIKEGEKVISHKSIEVVEAMIPQGKSEVFELKTRNHTIQATPNHPFLTKDGFVRLDKLKVGQKIIVHRYSASRFNRNKYTYDDMWILGFMLGDGWITENPDKKYNSMRLITCFAKGIYEERNQKALRILETKGKFKELKNGYYRSENITVGKYLKNLGFKGKAKTKRIPSYVFSRNVKLREAFIEGFLAADGYINNTLRCIELSNFDLIRDLKQLAESCGYKVSNIHSRTRLIQPPHSLKPILATSHHISIGNRKKKRTWDYETIISIKQMGIKEVYDLTISNTHNFIAEGLVVHNTRWHESDLYGWILDETNPARYEFITHERTAVEGNYQIVKETTTGKFKIEGGEIIFPTKFTRDGLEKLINDKGLSDFSSQYLNDPVPADHAIFHHEWKYYEEDDMKGMELINYILVDPAFFDSSSRSIDLDYTVFMIISVNANNDWFIRDIIRDRMAPKQILDTMFDLDAKWQPRTIGIESVSFQKVLSYMAREMMRERNQFLPITELKHAGQNAKSKEERIQGLEPRYAVGSIYHNRNVRQITTLELELRRFPRAKHDDCADALASALEVVRPPRKREERARGHIPNYPA